MERDVYKRQVWFSRLGSYKELLAVLGKKPGEVWTDEERQEFKATYDLFEKAFQLVRTEKMEMTASDAFLTYIKIFDYETARSRTADQFKKDLTKIRDEMCIRDRL